MRSAVSRLANRILRPARVELRKIRQELPHYPMIDVFKLCAEDLRIRVPRPFVLQIGANDGVINDPVHDLIVNYDLPALLIEPHPIAFQKLSEVYSGKNNVVMLNVAIGLVDQDSAPFYVPDDELVASVPRTHRLCSFSRAQLLQALKGVGVVNAENRIATINVPTKSVSTLLKENDLHRIDILQIDVEGYDWKVLSQFNTRESGISLINIEFFSLQDTEQRDCVSRLSAEGYRLSHFHGDLIAYLTP
jgi:FkbM family methyltransferase